MEERETDGTQWYLSEEKAESNRLQEDVRDKIHYIHGLEEEQQILRRRYEESEWYLGEEKARRAQLEVALQNAEQKCKDMELQLTEMRARYDALQKELNDTQRYLGEERGWRQKLEEHDRGPKTKKAQFKLLAPEAKRVFLVGDFNNWDVDNLPMKKTSKGTWETSFVLPPGRHEYRFWVDGVWCDDPNAQERVENPFGSQNSVRIYKLKK